MAGTQRLLAMAMAFSVAVVPASGKPETLGMVMQAEHAMLGAAAAAEGTTIYDGDGVSTAEEGTLTVRIGQAVVQLGERSSAILRGGAERGVKEFGVELLAGMALLSVAPGTTGQIESSTARVRPISDTRGLVQVQRVGPYELIVFAQRGPALISYHGESETIPEGKSYRVLLNPDDGSVPGDSGMKKAGHWRKPLTIAAIGAGAAVGIAMRAENRGKHKGMESPDRP